MAIKYIEYTLDTNNTGDWTKRDVKKYLKNLKNELEDIYKVPVYVDEKVCVPHPLNIVFEQNEDDFESFKIEDEIEQIISNIRI